MEKPDEIIYSSTVDVTKEPVNEAKKLINQFDSTIAMLANESAHKKLNELGYVLSGMSWDKPEQPEEWDGEGLPPVGVEIECRAADWESSWASYEWAKIVITAIGEVMFLSKDSPTSTNEATSFLANWEFRPIKSEAQQAEEELKALENDLADLIDRGINSPLKPLGIARAILQKLSQGKE